MGFPGSASGKESACQCRRLGFDPWVGKIPWRRKWQTTPVFLPGESHEQRRLVGYSLWGHKGLDTTEQLNKFRSTATVLFLSLPSMGIGSSCGMRRVGKYTRGLPRTDCLINVEMRVGRNGPSVWLSALRWGFASWYSSSLLGFHHVADVDDGGTEDRRVKRRGEPESGSYCSLSTFHPRTALWWDFFACTRMALLGCVNQVSQDFLWPEAKSILSDTDSFRQEFQWLVLFKPF